MSRNPAPNILHEADRLTSEDRNLTYGEPLDDWTRTAALMSAWLGDQLTSPLTAEQAAMLMVFVKQSRERHQHKPDNLIDAAGYLRVIEKIRQERERRGQ